MTTTETTSYRIEDARSPLWFGQLAGRMGHVVHGVDSGAGAHGGGDDRRGRACLDGRAAPARSGPREPDDGGEPRRVPVPRIVANVRSDTRAVLGVVGEGYEPLQNGAAFAFCDAITDSGEAHWLGAAETRGGARVHALMQLDREIRIGGAEGEDVLPLLCFRNGHDGGLAVTISVAPFRLACLNGMMLPLDGAERTWKARHTANLDARLADARRTLGIAWRYYDELEQIGGRLIRERMSAAEFERFLAQLVPLPEPRPDATNGGRAVRNVERVREAIATAYRATPDLREHHRHALGRAASRDRVRRPRPADPRDRRPQPPGGALRARDRAAAAQRPSARTSDRRRDAVMTATLSMVPLAKIRPSKANPRSEFDDERMAELIESVKRHGIITPLTLSRDGEGRSRSSPASAATARRRRRS